jgi:hypothetical protein
MVLTGVIYHEDYKLMSQESLDWLADDLELKRPRSFHFDSMAEMHDAVTALKGQEGICLYYNDGQNILKCKGEWYLGLHRMKSELSSAEKVMDVWLEQGKPSYEDFMQFLTNTFDFELAQQCRGNVSKICDAWKEVQVIEASMREKAESLKGKTRKDQALVILQAYGNTNRSSYVFRILDSRQLDNECYKKLLFQVMKNK